jgi:hypothetical protein
MWGKEKNFMNYALYFRYIKESCQQLQRAEYVSDKMYGAFRNILRDYKHL